MRHAHLIGARDPVMYRLVPALVRQMGAAFPELVRAEALITETLKLEESRFKQTLERGLRLLEDETGRLGAGQALPGEVAFKLYDTYGFPLDLTQDVLRGQGRTVDTAGFKTAMDHQRAEARKAWSGSGDAATGAVWFELKERLEPTEFLGYDTEIAEGVVTALVVDGKPVDQAGPGSEVVVLVNQTPFYGESGGQTGDAGTITLAGGAGGASVAVRDTQKQAGVLWAHIGTVSGGTLKVGDAVELKVDHGRRSAIRANHSATHLLHEALRRRLGEHVTQKGSLVAPERLRFDVSQPRPLTAEDIAVVEAEVNARIRENAEVTTRLMTPEDAIAAGAMALFGEKYGDTVRVVGMGQDGNKVYSQELCGGTHVGRTGDIGGFRLVSEGAVAAGIRRIEAVTGEGAVAHAAHRDALLIDAAAALKVTPEELPVRLAALVEERRRLEREVADLRRKLATAGEGGAAPEVKEIGGVKFTGRIIDDLPARELKPMADALKQQIGSGVIALIGRAEGKLSVCIGVTEDLTGRFDAVALVRAAAEAAGGKGGGGRPDMAQAGGPDAARAGEALAAVEAALAA